jgi:hypothetical protein
MSIGKIQMLDRFVSSHPFKMKENSTVCLAFPSLACYNGLNIYAVDSHRKLVGWISILI